MEALALLETYAEPKQVYATDSDRYLKLAETLAEKSGRNIEDAGSLAAATRDDYLTKVGLIEVDKRAQMIRDLYRFQVGSCEDDLYGETIPFYVG